MKNHIAFTICTKSYLAGALVWRNTLVDSDTNIRGIIYIVDSKAEDLSALYSEAKTISCSRNTDGLENDLRFVNDKDIPDNVGMRNRYEIIEYCTAIKPSIFILLARQYPGFVLHYFDPDIAVYGDLLELKKFSESHSITLLPHMTTPTEDNFNMSQLSVLRAGVFNFGYVGWNPHFKSGWPLIQWWQRRLNKDCRVALSEGIFTDQSWGVFFCGSKDSGIFYDTAYNVAYWNLHERNVDWQPDLGYTCNGKKLQFFHFSGYSPNDPEILSLHQNRHYLKGLRGLNRLFSSYKDQLFCAGYKTWQNNKSNDQIYCNNTQILEKKINENESVTLRRNIATHCIYTAFGDPNKAKILYGISWWAIYLLLDFINFIGNIKSLTLRNISYKKAEDTINKTYNCDGLIKKGLIYWYLTCKFYLKSTATRIIPSISKFNEEFPDARNVSIGESNTGFNSKLATEVFSNQNAIAVIGYITAETGLGESVRGIIRSMDSGNISTDLFDVRGHYARTMDSEFASRICDPVTPERKYRACLLHVNADQVPYLLPKDYGSLLVKCKRRIGYWYWETENLPHGQATASNYFDEIWVATEFVRESLINSGVKIPVKVIPPALSALPDAPFSRSHFQFPEDRPICLSVFDATSFLGRKNPIGVIRAIKEIYNGAKVKPLLVLKTTNLKDSDRDELLRLASPVDLRIINQYLSREETLSLVGTADCFISLHRAEGLGLSLIDAMRLGVPLVSTDYSGPKDFAKEDNAFLVPWEYCQARWADGPYFGSVWAEPNIKVAAEQIQRIIIKDEDVQMRTLRARQKVEEHFSRKRIADLIEKTLL